MPRPLLTDVPRVKEYLRSPIGEGGELILERFCTVASRLIRRETGRKFTVPRIATTREFRTYDFSTVYVDEVFSVADITSVTDSTGLALNYDLDWDGGDQNFPEDDPPMGATLEVKPLGLDFGITGLPEDHADYFIRDIRGDALIKYPEIVRVTGTFGYEEDGNPFEIPEEIRFAATRAVALWFKEEIAHYTEDAFISRGREFTPEALPPIVMATLRDWVAKYPVVV